MFLVPWPHLQVLAPCSSGVLSRAHFLRNRLAPSGNLICKYLECLSQGHPRLGWSLTTRFHGGSLASLFLGSLILCDVYDVSKRQLQRFTEEASGLVLISSLREVTRAQRAFWVLGAPTRLGPGPKMMRPSPGTWARSWKLGAIGFPFLTVFISSVIVSCFGCTACVFLPVNFHSCLCIFWAFSL